MMISRLHSGRGEDSKAGSDCQKGNELFHGALFFDLSRCRQKRGTSVGRSASEAIQRHTIF
ncbi:hypothetical protein [Prosthecobacter algae]|uniref:hypothetical protein n=1 Tax=Prosthecobacter algae TaxID=1144682 RepID=UPI0031E96D02